MNWEAIGALGEIIGALAVVTTLVYLAAQVRSGNQALRTSVRDSAFKQLQEWNLHLVQDRDLPLLFQQGTQDFESLEEAERVRFVHVTYSFLKMYENLFLHHRDGSLDGEAWDDTKAVFKLYVQQPGLQRYWESRRSLFNKDFVGMVDSIEPVAMPSGAEMLNLGPRRPT